MNTEKILPADTGPGATGFTTTDQLLQVMRRRFPQFDLSRLTLYCLIHFVSREMVDEANQVLKTVQLHYFSYALIMMLYGTENFALTPSAISAATREKPANTSRICGELEERGLICRQRVLNDGRKTLLVLTHVGVQFLESIFPDMLHVTGQKAGALRASERQTLERLLRKLIVTPVTP
ncbi:MAG: MarR family winged helix-turn-helix transcriptional regulator [Acidithiobacillus sp.]